MAIQVGDIVGDYRVTGILGRGGMGRVFRVRSLLTDREEAMKIVLPDLEENPELGERFLREIRIHASLQHPNIAALHSAVRIGDRLVMFLELVEGVSLEETLRRGPLDTGTALAWIRQVLDALACAHDRGVIHRDIKPANILIAAGGVVKLTDFGIARSEGVGRLTGTGLAVGTLAYMSPEQIRSEPVDGRSDLYSVGLTLYEMLTGRRAIAADTDHGLMNAQLNLLPPEPATVRPAISEHVSSAIMRAISKEPARRFQKAAEFAAALGESIPPRMPAPTAPASVPAGELAELETGLSRIIGPIARRLVADAARRCTNVDEIRHVLAEQIENPKERAQFLHGKPPTGTSVAHTPSGPMSFDPAALDRLTQALAPHVGPIAKVLVGRAARTARTLEQLHEALAAEIPAADDRQRFLRAVRSVL